MDFVKKSTGTIYHITNKNLLPFYQGSEAFEEVKEEKPVEKKTTTKKK